MHSTFKFPTGLFAKAAKRNQRTDLYWYYLLKTHTQDGTLRWGDTRKFAKFFNTSEQYLSKRIKNLCRIGFVEKKFDGKRGKFYCYQFKSHNKVWEYYGYNVKKNKHFIRTKGVYKETFVNRNIDSKLIKTIQTHVSLIKAPRPTSIQDLKDKIAYYETQTSNYRWYKRQTDDKRYGKSAHLIENSPYSCINLAQSLGYKTAMTGHNYFKKLEEQKMLYRTPTDQVIKHTNVKDYYNNYAYQQPEFGVYIWRPDFKGCFFGNVVFRTTYLISYSHIWDTGKLEDSNTKGSSNDKNKSYQEEPLDAFKL